MRPVSERRGLPDHRASLSQRNLRDVRNERRLRWWIDTRVLALG